MTRMRIALLLLVAASVAELSADCGLGRLTPYDEGDRNPSFAEFRRRLVDIVRRKDAPALLRLLDPAIRNSFGGDGGVAEFRDMWRPEQQSSEVWKELAQILAMGGSFREGGNQFWAPYVHSRWPDLDGYFHLAVIGSGVALRSQSSATAPVLARLSFDIVKVTPDGYRPESPWWKVSCGGRTGYVLRTEARSPIDFRAGFEKKAGRWVITYLIAGD